MHHLTVAENNSLIIFQLTIYRKVLEYWSKIDISFFYLDTLFQMKHKSVLRYW